jgi:hypothetical protein
MTAPLDPDATTPVALEVFEAMHAGSPSAWRPRSEDTLRNPLRAQWM